MDDETGFGKLLSWGELLRYADVFRREYVNEADKWLAGPLSFEEFLGQVAEKCSAADIKVFRSRRVWRQDGEATLSLELVRFRFLGTRSCYAVVVAGRSPIRFCGRETICEGDGPVRSWLCGEKVDEEGRPETWRSLSGICSDVADAWSWSEVDGGVGEHFEILTDKHVTFPGEDQW